MAKPSYISSEEGPGGATESSRPSYIGSNDEATPRGRFKKSAEQYGVAMPWERERLGEPVVSDGGQGLNTNLPVGHLPQKEGEAQPPGFQPYSFIKDKVFEFLAKPQLSAKSYQLERRIVFEQRDIAGVDIGGAREANIEHTIILGRELEQSRSKLFVQFAIPSPDTTLKAMKAILTVLLDWASGKEATAEKVPVDNIKRGSTTVHGREIRSAPVAPLRYNQKLYIFGAFDHPNEVAVILA